jgi:hypothetical protein
MEFRLAVVVLVTLTAIAFADPGLGHGQTRDRDRAKIVEDAKKEGKVMVYVSSNASDARALEAAFEKISIRQYGILRLGEGRAFDALHA